MSTKKKSKRANVGKPIVSRRSPETLDELIEYLDWSLERAEDIDWCALTLLADESTHELLNDLRLVRALANGG